MQLGTRATFFILACIALNLLQFVQCGPAIKIHESANLPTSVYRRIIETRKMIGGEAHVFPITAIWTGMYYNMSMNVRSPPHRLNNTFIQDEIFINIRNDPTLTNADEIWIESSKRNLLARVPVHRTNKNGYRAVKMRGVSLEWMNNLKISRGLNLKMKRAKKLKTLKTVLGTKAYFVVYVYSTEALLNLSKAVTCDSYDVTINFQSILALDTFQTKICSRPDDVTFPFDVSDVFDVGMAFRRAIRQNPVPKDESVLKNPKCCQPTKVAPRSFVDFVNGNIQVSRLKKVQITECGCWTK